MNAVKSPNAPPPKKMIRPASAHSFNLKRKFQSSEVSLTFSLCLCDTLECSDASEFVALCKEGFFSSSSSSSVCSVFVHISEQLFAPRETRGVSPDSCWLWLDSCASWSRYEMRWQIPSHTATLCLVRRRFEIVHRGVWVQAYSSGPQWVQAVHLSISTFSILDGPSCCEVCGPIRRL